MKLSIVMPCLNEEDTLAICIKKVLDFLQLNSIDGEVVVADNGSTDASVKIALQNGARVVPVAGKGYGAALQGGITAANGDYIIMGDADDSYNFSDLMPFIEKLNDGYDLVMGNRFKGGIKKGAMPFLHRYLGNPVLSFVGRLFFKSSIGDFHCGLRAFTKKAFEKMELKSMGMEFASEMVVKATMFDMKITEVPTTLSPDGRNRPPHLNTWHDGWRHLRFLLLFAPNWLLLLPGLFLFAVGIVFGTILMLTPVKIGTITFDIHTLLYMMVFAIVGCQLLILFIIVKNFVMSSKIFPEKNPNKWIYNIKLEKGIAIGIFIFCTGFIISVHNYLNWSAVNFGNLDPSTTMKQVIPSAFCLSLGIQLIVGCFVNTLMKKN